MNCRTRNTQPTASASSVPFNANAHEMDDMEEAGSVTREGNHIWFYSDVTVQSIADLSREITSLARELRLEQTDLGADSPRPIHLHICSDGGDVNAGLAAADLVAACPVPVHTHVEGRCNSAATFFSICGKVRTITPNSVMLIHQLSTGFMGKYREMLDATQRADLLMTLMFNLYGNNTTLKPKKIRRFLGKDVYFSASDALKHGLVDKIG